MTNLHGDFIWYELLTSDPDAAQEFYGEVIGWTAAEHPAGMGYRVFSGSEGEVAGFMALSEEMVAGGALPGWLGYVGVDDVDKMAGSIASSGGAIHVPPTDIPGVGRFALVADPQGSVFYVMKGVSDEESHAFSYDRPRIGHCAWNELMTTDVAAAEQFYGKHFGWVKDGEMDMGDLGKYEFLRHAGRAPDGSPMGQGMLGAVMPMMPGGAPMPVWSFYFRVPDIDAAASAITANGGTLFQEPMEIPGGDYSLNASDPQGASFGLVGARKGS